jgi:cell division protein FtsQ
VWDDDAPAESRFRRVQQSAPTSGRGLPFEVDDAIDSRKQRAVRTPWWRPTGPWGRAAMASGLLILAGTFAYAYYECKSFFEHDTRFRIAGTTSIQAVGLTEVNRSEILSVFGEDIGRNVFFVPLSERRKQLEQIPWIQQATVMRLLPDQIRVSIVERQPVAFVRHGQQIGLVDGNGVLLSMPPGLMSEHHYSFPVLTGIDAGDPLLSRRARVDLYLRLMGELDGNGQHLSDQVSEIDLTDPEDARVLMPEQGTDVLAHFGEDHFLERYQRYKAHIGDWRQQYPKLSAVDLRYEQQVVLEMNQGQATTQPTLNVGSATPSKPAAAKPVAAKPVDIAVHKTSAKPDAGKRAAVAAPAVPVHAVAKKPATPHEVAAKATTTKKPALTHAVATKGLTSKKSSLKTASEKTKGKKHAQAKPVVQKKSKPKPQTKAHAAARATAGQ